MNNANTTLRAAPKGEAGFGLVEIIVSMFLLTLLSVAFLPLLISALQATVRNSTVATASQILSEQLDAVTLVPRTCAAFTQFASQALASVTDDRGTEYQPARQVTGCPPGAYPARVTIRVSVAVTDQPEIRVEATTFGVVESAN
jgi:type II secretory pathway pseudopilin PulG